MYLYYTTHTHTHWVHSMLENRKIKEGGSGLSMDADAVYMSVCVYIFSE